MRRISFLILLIFLPIFSWAQNPSEINWMTFEQLDSALNTKPKKTLIFFYADWCVYCKKMERTAFRNPEIIELLNINFYAVKMDAEQKTPVHFDGETIYNRQTTKREGAYHDLALMLGSRDGKPFSLPATILMDEDFNVLNRSFEYLSPDQMMDFLQGNSEE